MRLGPARQSLHLASGKQVSSFINSDCLVYVLNFSYTYKGNDMKQCNPNLCIFANIVVILLLICSFLISSTYANQKDDIKEYLDAISALFNDYSMESRKRSELAMGASDDIISSPRFNF